jgi:hypothetical protein
VPLHPPRFVYGAAFEESLRRYAHGAGVLFVPVFESQRDRKAYNAQLRLADALNGNATAYRTAALVTTKVPCGVLIDGDGPRLTAYKAGSSKWWIPYKKHFGLRFVFSLEDAPEHALSVEPRVAIFGMPPSRTVGAQMGSHTVPSGARRMQCPATSSTTKFSGRRRDHVPHGRAAGLGVRPSASKSGALAVDTRVPRGKNRLVED